MILFQLKNGFIFKLIIYSMIVLYATKEPHLIIQIKKIK